jgi:hypothetical protein
MIYGLLHQNVAHADRWAIARAILNRDVATLHAYVSRRDIVHVMDRVAGAQFFCIYCQNSIFATDARPGDHGAQNPWHFEHARGACRMESQLPKRTPLTRVISAANSGASNPLSAASTASLRTAVIRTLMETAPSPWVSRTTRQAHTVDLVNPGRGSRPYHSKNSSRPRLYTRRVIGDETLSSTKSLQPLPMGSLRNNNQISHLGPLNGQYR